VSAAGVHESRTFGPHGIEPCTSGVCPRMSRMSANADVVHPADRLRPSRNMIRAGRGRRLMPISATSRKLGICHSRPGYRNQGGGSCDTAPSHTRSLLSCSSRRRGLKTRSKTTSKIPDPGPGGVMLLLLVLLVVFYPVPPGSRDSRLRARLRGRSFIRLHFVSAPAPSRTRSLLSCSSRRRGLTVSAAGADINLAGAG